jgi:hypothetical protein
MYLKMLSLRKRALLSDVSQLLQGLESRYSGYHSNHSIVTHEKSMRRVDF